MRYNEDFIKILDELKDIMVKQGDPFRAKAYNKALETVMVFPEDITDPQKQLKGLPGIGTTILTKLEEYVKSGKVASLEKERNNPVNIFTQIYGIGPKKAQELVSAGIKTIDDLRKNQGALNDTQKVGLEYYDDIQKRIPRDEIEEFKGLFTAIFDSVAPDGSSFEIVGSYRRGAKTSGDIDIIITNQYDNRLAFDNVLDVLIKNKIITVVLSRGKIKSLTLVKIKEDGPVRRVDFLYAPPSEHAFAILYFTGSKIFNTIMRQRALDLGYTLNEHGLSYMKDGVKGKKIEGDFPTEKSIFDFLGMKYKTPEDRVDGKALNKSSPLNPAKDEKLMGLEGLPPKDNGGLGGLPLHNKTLKKQKIVSSTELIDKFKSEGISALKMMTENELNQLIRDANKAYYCEDDDDDNDDDDSLLSDSLYDILVEYVQKKYPQNTVAKEGHSSCSVTVEKSKAKLPYELWSMDKIKPDTNALNKWTKTYKGPYVISCKLDGVSGLYSTEGDVPKLYTRGNGKIGQDISHLIPYLRLPTTKGITIRGEFVISKKTFKEKYSSFSSPRNFAFGIINQKKIEPTKFKDLDFVAYEVIQPALLPSDQMKFLEKEDVRVVLFHEEKNITNELLSQILIDWREKYEFEIDGIIVIDNKIYPRPKKNPEYAFAFKMVLSDQVVEAKVVDVLWGASKDGYLKPRVQIEPVVLSGAKIEYATGFNAKFIQDNKIGVGALISIVRSGDVIPHILSVVQPAEKAMMPSVPYKWNETGVDIMLVDKEDDATVREKNITGFFKGIGVEGLGPGNVKRIIEAGYNTVPKIIAMGHSDYLKVEGFKDKLATKIMGSIKARVDSASLAELMAASNIFGRGFGERRFAAILKAYPDILVSDIGNKEKTAMVAGLEGFANKTAQKFVENIGGFVAFMNDAGLEGKLYYAEDSHIPAIGEGDHSLQGKSIVMTGFRNKELMEKIKAVGGNNATAVSKNTFIVLVKDTDEDTGKADQARKLNIPLMTPDAFMAKYFA